MGVNLKICIKNVYKDRRILRLKMNAREGYIYNSSRIDHYRIKNLSIKNPLKEKTIIDT